MTAHRRRVTVSSLRGAVAAAHPLAAQAGARVLREGGNAFDAAAATAAALNVVEPFMSGLGGMGVATCFSARDGRVHVLDFVPPAPRRFPPSGVTSHAHALRAAHAVGIPGNLAGWHALVERFGTRPLGGLLAPAIELAREGFPLTEFAAHEFAGAAEGIRSQGGEFLERWMNAYGVAGRLPVVGDVLRQPGLARTFEAIAAEGVGWLYGGGLGRAMVDLAGRHGSVLGIDDLEAYRPKWVPPVSIGYQGLVVHVPPPPAEAFQYLLTLRLLEGIAPNRGEPDGIAHLDAVMRAVRIAAMTRIEHNLPAPDELLELLSDRGLAPLLDRLHDGRPVDGPVEQSAEPVPGATQQHTTSFSIADAAGNAICVTQSLGSPFGCGLVLDDHGVCLTNLLAWGDMHPGGPKQLRANGPLALPIAPSLATSAGRPAVLLGTPGSYGIPQTQAQVMVQHLRFGLPIQEAIEAPRFRLLDGRAVLMEDRFDARVVDGLRRCGHVIESAPAWTRLVGGVQAVVIDPARGGISGGADPRRDGYVATP
jgi:gamma-glutamyltranspeptidase/glutathione hydrolase